MSVLTHEDENFVQLYIDNIFSENDLFKIDNYIGNTKYNYEINIMNVHSIPADVIKSLSRLENYTIYVNEITLYQYLQKLSLNAVLKNAYTKSARSYEYIILIGDDLRSMEDLIASMPASDKSFFILLNKNEYDLIDQIRGLNDNYIVKKVQETQPITPKTIYLITDNESVTIDLNHIYVDSKNTHDGSVKSLFRSLKESNSAYKCLIVVFSYSNDMVRDLQSMLYYQAMILLEDNKENNLSDIFQENNYVKFFSQILNKEKIVQMLLSSIESEDILVYMDDFLEKLFAVYGYDFRHYKRMHIYRRVELFYKRTSFKSFAEFQNRVLKDKDLFCDLFFHIAVNVTSFFRNPDVYMFMRSFIKERYSSKKEIRIWSAGSSSGEEPYSIAILLDELGLLDKTLVYATDHDKDILTVSKNGIYKRDTIEKEFFENYISSGGKNKADKYFYIDQKYATVKKHIKNSVLHFSHSLIHDRKFHSFDIIFCRNVIIYFDKVLKERIFELFYDSLEDDGVLVLGESEAVLDTNYFIAVDESYKVYKKNKHSLHPLKTIV